MIDVQVFVGNQIRPMRGKPIMSRGLPHSRQFVLCSRIVDDRGLPAVLYFVVDVRSGCVQGVGGTKVQALGMAKDFLSQHSEFAVEGALLQMEEMRDTFIREQMDARRAMDLECTNVRRLTPKITKRRKAIFEKSDGKCHYCKLVLVLEDGWHVEHMLPRSKGGTDLMDNLVAACPKCNHQKHAMTAEEFIASRSDEPASLRSA